MRTILEAVHKIRKLLRLSSSANENEAELALRRAQEVALRYNIDIASVERDDDFASAGQYEKAEFQHKRSVHSKFVYSLLITHFDVAIVTSPAKQLVYFIGTKSSIEFAQWVAEFLGQEFPRLWISYRHQTGVREGQRNTYFFGLYKGLDAKLRDNKQRLEAEMFEKIQHTQGRERARSVANRYALTLRGLEEATAAFFPHARRESSRVAVRDAGVFEHGQRDGRTINIAPPLDQGGQKLLC